MPDPNAPDTLPPDFFDKTLPSGGGRGGQRAAPAPDTLPADFFDKPQAPQKTGWEPVNPKDLDPWATDTAVPRPDNPYGKAVMDNTIGGVSDIRNGEYARGAHKLINAAGVAAAPLLVEPLVAAPLATLAGAGFGAAGSAGARAAAKGLFGATDDQADLAGDVGGAATGLGTSMLTKVFGKGAAKGFSNSALSGTWKSKQFGADPGLAALMETEGIRPATVAKSAAKRIADIAPVLETKIAQANPVPLAGPKGKIVSGKKFAVATNDPTLHSELTPMGEHFEQNFATGEKYPEIVPATEALNLRRGFGNQHVRWVQGRTTKANDTAKGAYGALTDAIHEAAPGTEELDSRIHNLIPARDLAVKADLHAGPIETGINRSTRPTGGFMPAMSAFFHHGPGAGGAVLAAQEALSNPAVKMAIARGLYRSVGGPRLGVPEMPLRQIAAPADSSGVFPAWIANLRNVGNEGSEFAPQTKLLPAATSKIGVSGTIVPDIIGRSSRGMGTPHPLIEAAPGGMPSSGTAQPFRFGRSTKVATPGRSGIPISDVSGPGAKTVGTKTAIPMPPAGTFKNPYRP